MKTLKPQSIKTVEDDVDDSNDDDDSTHSCEENRHTGPRETADGNIRESFAENQQTPRRPRWFLIKKSRDT
jgi:hypothetical protein